MDAHGFRYLIRDGAGQFTASFDTVLAGTLTYRIEASSLTLMNPDGGGLTLRAVECA